MPRHPGPPELRQLLEGLLGRSVAVTLRPRTADAIPPFIAASYIDALGAVAAVSWGDLGFAASTGASLALIPALQAEEWITAGETTSDAWDNASEVFNIAASVLNDVNQRRHVKLAQVWNENDGWPDDAEAVPRIARRADAFDVAVDGYPAGRWAFASR